MLFRSAQALEEGSVGKKTKITTPQSVNLDFQTGIMANTVAFANVRWVNWKDFAIQPYKFGLLSQQIGGLVGRPNGFNLVEYADDQWSVNAGVGRKLSEQWAVIQGCHPYSHPLDLPSHQSLP